MDKKAPAFTPETKELFMELVEVSRNEVHCDSHIVAKKFGYKNANVANVIEKVISDLKDIKVDGADPKVMTDLTIQRCPPTMSTKRKCL